MADNAEHGEIETFPSDIEVREGGKISLFLKLTYVGFTAFGVLYWVLYYAGDKDLPLVQLLNAATGH
jgi:hypothetical protein